MSYKAQPEEREKWRSFLFRRLDLLNRTDPDKGGWARSIARKIVASTLRKGVRLFASTMPYKA
jgi:hypothetical protein